MRNSLYYGDNLAVMREHIANESVDLVYLDPPFNSARDYNVLFRQVKGDENQAQITAFTDTWNFTSKTYSDFFDDPRNAKLFDLMESLYRILDKSEMMAYLLMMAPRLLELHRVLKPTGTLYLHCDPAASHYLKITLDAVFGPRGFRNEIVWKRFSSHGNVFKSCGRVHDLLLRYSKTSSWIWNQVRRPLSQAYIDGFFTHVEPETGRRYRVQNVLNPNRNRPNLTYEWNGHTRVWKWSRDRMQELHDAGLLVYGKDGLLNGFKQYLDQSEGEKISDLWDDIKPVGQSGDTNLGYPTQKPLALLERTISASSNPGDIVLDPFCGCGTAVVAAEKLGRHWIGIDVTFIAVDLIITRLKKDFGLNRGEDYHVGGDPYDAHSAGKLFEQSPKEFETWAVRKVGGIPQPEKSGDKGVDGKVYFGDENRKLRHAVCQVKGGHLTPSMIRDFAHVIERDKAAMGFFICLDTPTKGMYQEAEELGFFDSPSGRKIPKLQIRTIKELLENKEFDFPRGWSLRSGGGKKLVRDGEQPELGI